MNQIPKPAFPQPLPPFRSRETSVSFRPKDQEDSKQVPLYGCREQSQLLLDGLRQVTRPRTSSSSSDKTQHDARNSLLPRETQKEQPRRKFMLISGDSGTGKTALATSALQRSTHQANGYFLQGKFDQFQQNLSQNVIANALGQYASLIQSNQNLKQYIQKAVGRDARCLVDRIPGLAVLFKEQLSLESLASLEKNDGSSSSNNSRPLTNEWMQDMTTLKSRTRGAFLQFVAAICQPHRPIVLFLDDLQWSRRDDLDLIQDLMTCTEQDLEGLLIVGACRIVDPQHDLSRFIRSLAAQIDITDVIVSNLSALDVEEYLETAFPTMTKTDCQYLARFVVLQTDGNFFFMKQLLNNLLDEGLVIISSDGSSVTLDRQRLDVRANCDDILHFIVAKLQRLPQEIQDLLRAASCLGVRFTVDLLHHVLARKLEKSNESVDDLLMTCVRKGILTSETSSTQPLQWGFTHDRIQQAAYMLIPEHEQKKFHLSIGRKLRHQLTAKDLDQHLLLVTNQHLVGVDLVKAQQEKDELAALCLRTGQKAVTQSNFEDAGVYIDTGLSLLGTARWQSNYNLCLALFNAGAEISYVRADHERLEALTAAVFANAKTFEDTLESHTVHVFSLGSRYKLKEAIAEGRKVLERLGEPLPSNFGYLQMCYEQYKTKRKLSRYTDRSLLDLPAMTDPKKLAAMRMLNILYSYTFWSGDPGALCITHRAVQMSLDHGLCGMSGVAFVFYAGYLCYFGDVKRGNRYGDVSLRIVDRFHSKQWQGRVTITAYSFVKPWQRPIYELADTLGSSAKLCMATGDIEFGALGGVLDLCYRFMSGQPLELCYEAACNHQKVLLHHQQEVVLSFFQPQMQAMASLYGQSEDPLVLTGKFMEEQDHLEATLKHNNWLAYSILFLSKAHVAIILNEYEMADEWAKKSMVLKKTTNMSAPMLFTQLFIEGFANLASNQPNIARAKRSIQELRFHAKTAPKVLAHRIACLEAELARIKNCHDEAMDKYETAIALAQRSGYIHEQGICCERASLCLSRNGQTAEATRYLNEALGLYAQWGCAYKVQQTERLLASIK